MKEWLAALKAHRGGGDSHKTQVLIAELAALFARYASAKAGKPPSKTAADFMPWLMTENNKKQSVDEQISHFFRRFRS